MLFLPNTTWKAQVITTAAGDIGVYASWADVSGTTVTPGATLTRITTAATTDVVASPAASTVRNVKDLKVGNNSGSVTNTVTIQVTDGTTTIPMESVTLAPGERLSYVEGTGIRAFDAQGREKVTTVSGVLASANNADQTANAADTYIAGASFPVTGRLQAGTMLRWKISATKTAAGIATPIWNVRFGTAGTTADTARLTFTGLAQTGVADTARFAVEVVVRSVGASGVISGTYAVTAHRLASTGFVNQAVDCVQATSAAFDTTVASSVIGISVNPGTAGVWTIKDVSLDVSNALT